MPCALAPWYVMCCFLRCVCELLYPTCISNKWLTRCKLREVGFPQKHATFIDSLQKHVIYAFRAPLGTLLPSLLETTPPPHPPHPFFSKNWHTGLSLTLVDTSARGLGQLNFPQTMCHGALFWEALHNSV